VLKEIIGTKEFVIKDTFEKSGEHTFALNNLNLSPKLYLLTISINNAQALYQLIRIPQQVLEPKDQKNQYSIESKKEGAKGRF
nr:hypothetical protein [Bacteroidota bacterium]